MKKIAFFGLVLFASIFTACTDSSDDIISLAELKGADYLERLTQPILFQYVNVDQNGRWTEGWIINREGAVHEVQIDQAQLLEPTYGVGSEYQLDRLYDSKVAEVATVDLNDLAEYHKELLKVRTSSDEEIELQTGPMLYGIKVEAKQGTFSGGNCGNAHHYRNARTEYYQWLDVASLTSGSTDMMSWLQSINSEVSN